MALDQQVRQGAENSRFSRVFSDLLGQSLPRLLKVLARREDFYKLRLTRSLVLLDFQLSEEQATKLADWLLQVVLPDVIRQLIVDFLTDRTFN